MIDENCISMDNSPLKNESGSPNSSASSLSSLNKVSSSWAIEVELYERRQNKLKTSIKNSHSLLDNKLEISNSKNVVPQCKLKQEDNLETSEGRDISLDFIEGVNEKKFERLIKEEKLKTPFKRRHSHESSNERQSVSPNSTNSDGGGGHLSSRKEEKRLRQNSYSSSTSSSSFTESDPAILTRRQKQIDYGKNTVAYEQYMNSVQKSERNRDHPRTPNKFGKYSRRAFDGLVKIWRKQLHSYDPPSEHRLRHDISSDTDSD